MMNPERPGWLLPLAFSLRMYQSPTLFVVDGVLTVLDLVGYCSDMIQARSLVSFTDPSDY